MKKKILLIGGYTKAKSLAESLIEKGYRVVIINLDRDVCEELADLEEVDIIRGDGTKPSVLEEANASECDISITLTSKDQDNLVASELCKKRFGVKKTVSLVTDPEKTEFFRMMGVDCVVCALSAITNIIEHQAFIDEMATSIPIGEGRAQIVEVYITPEAAANGRKLWEISLPQEVIIGCIIRGDNTVIPRGDTRILAGDTLIVISGNGQEMAAVRSLTGR